MGRLHVEKREFELQKGTMSFRFWVEGVKGD